MNQLVACGSTETLVAGGYDGSRIKCIDYVEIASTGNATDFGDLTYEVFQVFKVQQLVTEDYNNV